LKTLGLVQSNIEAQEILSKHISLDASNIKNIVLLATGNKQLADKLETEFLLQEKTK
jgi:hypothetical protein